MSRLQITVEIQASDDGPATKYSSDGTTLIISDDSHLDGLSVLVTDFEFALDVLSELRKLADRLG